MDTEKTLLQQIRDKEQEFKKKIDTARADADALVTAAKTEADELLCTADETGKKHAEKVYGDIREKTVTDIEILDKNAELDRLASLERGEKYVPAAVEKIVSYVTME
ncbi:V-type ATPase subunit subunit G family protein [Methanoregula sp.]|jgi:vacuolar-type H+-ATPase subunit H|uniref:V-type ATPase subunit subunit G family protein n=1 Tax=Methanoregula sp. TaxID=2052170 RepID=UPI003C290BF6